MRERGETASPPLHFCDNWSTREKKPSQTFLLLINASSPFSFTKIRGSLLKIPPAVSYASYTLTLIPNCRIKFADTDTWPRRVSENLFRINLRDIRRQHYKTSRSGLISHFGDGFLCHFGRASTESIYPVKVDG